METVLDPKKDTVETASLDTNKVAQEPSTVEDMEVAQESNKRNQKGGLRTMPFIIANEAFEKVASFGLMPNMILYLMNEYHMSLSNGVTVITMFGAITNFFPFVGAFIADTYLGRFHTIAWGCLASLLGMVLLWLTAMISGARPPTCNPSSQNCASADGGQLTLLFAAFVLMAVGAGGIRPCSLAFGAEQVDREDNPNNNKLLQTFFNWYYTSSTVAVLIALTVIVYVQDHAGWKIGFSLPAICMLISAVCFLLASSLYIKAKPNKSLFVGFVQVPVAYYRNRHIALPPNGRYHHISRSKMVVPSNKLRFMNKACLITNAEKDLNADGSASNPWSLCTVQQVEELKALLKVTPLWSTGIVMSVSMNAASFPLLQANTMNRHVTSNFQIPAGSFNMFTIITIVIWLPIYDRLVVPLLAKITGKPYGIGLKQRMGVGIVLTCVGSAVSAIVESHRRSIAIKQGFSDNPQGVLDMSAMWLVPQYCIGGLAEAFYAVGQNEFNYSEFPSTMSSVATSLFGLGMAFGNLISGALVNIVDDATKKGGKESWLSRNLNKGHFDYFYWLLTGIAAFNILYYILCSWAYGPCERERTDQVKNEDEGTKEEELPKSRELQMVASA